MRYFLSVIAIWFVVSIAEAQQVDCEAVVYNSKITADEIARVYQIQKETGIPESEVFRLGELTIYLIYLKEVFITYCEVRT